MDLWQKLKPIKYILFRQKLRIANNRRESEIYPWTMRILLVLISVIEEKKHTVVGNALKYSCSKKPVTGIFKVSQTLTRSKHVLDKETYSITAARIGQSVR